MPRFVPQPTRRQALTLIAGAALAAPAVHAVAQSRIAARWTTGNRRTTPAARQGDRLAVAGETEIAVLDLASPGRVIWRAALASPGAVFRPRVAGDIVVCGNGTALTAWRLSDGQELWRYAAEIQTGPPNLAGDRIAFGDGHRVVSAALDTGAVLWRFAGVPDTLASFAPLTLDDLIYAGPGDGRLYALRASDGQLVWQIDRMREWQYLRQIHSTAGILVAGSYREVLYGIEPHRGDVLWRFQAGNFINSHHAQDGVAYLWSPTGWVFAIDAMTGHERWRHRTTDYGHAAANWGPLMAELVSANDKLFALAMDHVLHVLDLRSGDELTRYALPEPMRPFVVPETQDSVLLGSENGEIIRWMLA